jgi:hypothetical protein
MSALPLNIALPLFGLTLLLAACGHRDQPPKPSADGKLREALTGTWTKEDPSLGYVSLASNGTFSGQWNTTNKQMKVWAYEGTWTATGGVCVSTTTRTRSWGHDKPYG